MSLPPGTRGILVDIEGTTTPIAFVHETLFPFAERRLDVYCARGGGDPRITAAIEQLRAEHRREIESGQAGTPAFGDGAAYARHLMAQDRKSTGLKALQGIIWEEGYRDGVLRAPIFDDVIDALAAWRRAGIRVRVYSSGSIHAQELLFSHTDQGDLTEYFEAYHDTTTGPKREAASYRAIAAAFGLPAEAILFLSDVVEELDAARRAGLRTALLDRPGNRPSVPGDHAVHRDFRPLHP